MRKNMFCAWLLTAVSLTAVAQADTTHRDYVGKYVFPAGSVVPVVEVAGDSTSALTMISEAGTSPLKMEGVDSFSIVNFNGTAAFRRHEQSRKVIGVHIEAMGYVLDGEKDPATSAWRWRTARKEEQPAGTR